MKAILIINLPMMCAECPMFTWASRDNYSDGFCTQNHKLVKFDLRPLDCPLKPMPQKKETDSTGTIEEYMLKGYDRGWNDCLKEICDESNISY